MLELRRRDAAVVRIGHRGAAALAPENTLRAFDVAVELGVDLVEFDVLALADGTLVLAHSDDLREITHGAARGRVGRRTLAELRRLAPDLPTLDDALAHLAGVPRVGLHLDLKSPAFEAPVVEALRSHGLLDRTLVASFFPESLLAVAALEPALRLGLAYPLDRHALARRVRFAPAVVGALLAMRAALPGRIAFWLDRTGATVASLHYLVVTRAVVARCHELDAAVLAWTVDDRRVLARLLAAGVDGIITNDPRIFAGTVTT